MGAYGQGKAFSLRFAQLSTLPVHFDTRKPAVNYVTVRQPLFGSAPMPFMCPAFVPFSQPKVDYGALVLGAVTGFAGALAANKSQNNSGITNQYAYLNNQAQLGLQNKVVNYKQNLVEMYGKNYNIVDDGNGNFRATDKATMKSYGPATYDEMCNLLGCQA